MAGNAEPYDKFLAWAETVPHLIGNPLYHWTYLELQRYFGIDEPLNKASAPEIWKAANEKLRYDGSLSVYGIFKGFKVYAVGTTDDPADTLEWHEKAAAAKGTGTKAAKIVYIIMSILYKEIYHEQSKWKSRRARPESRYRRLYRLLQHLQQNH
jgi:glucuronate isomerase